MICIEKMARIKKKDYKLLRKNKVALPARVLNCNNRSSCGFISRTNYNSPSVFFMGACRVHEREMETFISCLVFIKEFSSKKYSSRQLVSRSNYL